MSKTTSVNTAANVYCDPIDSLALVEFYNQTSSGGPCPPSASTGWTTPWNLSDNVCDWPGITLNADGRVTHVELNSTGLTGPLPAELTILTELIVLRLSNNCLTGTIPTSFGDLTNVQTLWLDGNEFVGPIPEELCNMSTLSVLFLDENNFTGTFPACFDDLFALGSIDLFDNCFDSLPDLTGANSLSNDDLEVYDNKLTFDDILPNIDVVGTFYHPQDSVCLEIDTTVQTGTAFNLSLGIDAGITTSSYQWYKNGAIFGAPTSTNTLTFDPVTFADAGVYHCQVTNPGAPLLTLYSRAKTVNVVCGTSSFEYVETVCDGFEIEFGGVTYNSSNPFYSDTFLGGDQFGCDSTVLIDLTYSTPPPTMMDTTICPGTSIFVNGTEYNESNDSGLEEFGIPDQFGCDSTVQVNVSFYPEATSNLTPTICADDTITIEGTEFHFLDSTGQVIIPGVSYHGCDSIINVDLNFYPVDTALIDDSYCTGQSVTINGTIYNAGNPDGIEILENESWRGCDSIIRVDLNFGGGVTYNLDTTFCGNQEVIVNSVVYDCDNPNGSETITGGSYLGCDSTIVVNITCTDPENGTLDTMLCSGGSFIYYGVEFDIDNTSEAVNIGTLGQNGCDSIVDVTISFFNNSFSILDTTICENEILIIDGNPISSNGPVVISEGSFNGCDSTVFVTITILPLATETIDDVLCPGQSITVNGTVYDEDNLSGEETIPGGAANGCDSVITIDISYGDAVISQNDEVLCFGDSLIIDGEVLNETNPIYTDTLIGGSVSGCDSITIIEVSYYPEAISEHSPDLCPGESLEFGGVTIGAGNPSDTIILENGSYTGCDSTIRVVANLLTVPLGSFTETLCPGESIIINGTTYDESNDNGIETIPSGSYQMCDSSFTVVIDFHEMASSTLMDTLCFGTDTLIAGTLINAANPVDTIIIDGGSYTGCDSTLFVNMSFYDEAVETISFTLCFGQSIIVNGTEYDQDNPTGTEEIPGGSYLGCDSIVNINLSFNNAVEVDILDVFCDPSEQVIVNGNIYDIDNPMGIDTMLSVSGCDSIVTTNLTFPDSAFVYYNNILCSGDELIVNGVTYNESMPQGTEVEPGASLFGCDVYHVVDLSFYDLSEFTLNETLCAGQDTLIEGILFDESHMTDTIILSGAAFNNCDSFLIVNVDFFPEIITTIDSSLCDEQFILVNGTAYDIDMPTGTEVMTAANGCDSTINITLNFGGAVINEETETLCEGEEIVINGTLYNADNLMGSDTFPGGSFTGCDSIVNINIVILSNSVHVIDTTLCPGENIVVNNITYDSNNLSGMDTLIGANYLNCDSILDVTVNYFPVSENTIDTTLCDGTSFIWGGMTYPPDTEEVIDIITGGSYTGCDSTLTINISYYPLATASQSATICEGDTVFWNGLSLTATGIYEEVLIGQSYQGCDSTDVMDLTVVSPADLGFANAGNDMITCGGTISLSANQPANTTGSWIILEGSATFGDPALATTQLNDMSHDSLVLIWSLSNDICPNYDTDTITIMTGVIPDAVDDSYVGDEGVLEVRLNILENDDYEGIDAWYYNLIDAPTGDLTNQGDGQYNYLAPLDSLGKTISFDYELCNEDCPEVCDTATVRIQLIEAELQDFPNTITVNGDGVNDFFVIPDIEDQPDQFNIQELIVFNRWGNIVYTAKPYLNDWGGTNQNGKELPQGTYYYILRLDIGAGIIYRGDITILK